MSCRNSNVIPFPGVSARAPVTCPACGRHSGLRRLGRLLWGVCNRHELRWVAADLGDAAVRDYDRAQLRANLNYLSRFAEVSR